MSKFNRRLEALERLIFSAPELIENRYLIEAVPPISESLWPHTKAWCDRVEAGERVPGMDCPETTTDEDKAIWIVKFVPTDIPVTPDGAASLLVEAYWLRDRDQHNEDYAWRHQRSRAELGKRITDRWNVFDRNEVRS